jgi:membrane-bound lytic murein transglycosylase D
MNPVSQLNPDDVADARQRKAVPRLARTALATFVALQLTCTLTGCAAMPEKRADAAGAEGPRFASAGSADFFSEAPLAAKQVKASRSGDATPSFFARLFGGEAPAPAAKAERPADDVWDKLRRGFTLDDRHDNRVSRAAAQYSSSQEHWNAIEDRARQFLPLVAQEVSKRNMPLELALLPVVESTYNPTAVGGTAAGLWQIIPGTAKTLGLRRDGGYDGRRDVVAATDAALDYLQALASEFDGDWELALAAYNAGSGTVQRAIAANRAKGKPTDYWSLDLPSHTEAYVPKLLGIARVIRNPEAYGMQLGDVPADPTVTPVQVAEAIDLSMAARLSGMSVTEFRELNPGFLSTKASPKGEQVFLVPSHKAAGLVAQLSVRSLEAADRQVRESLDIAPESRVAASQPAAPARNTAGGPKTHVVGDGDTLWTVARENGMAVAALAKANGIKTDAVLRKGQRLSIPGGPARTSQSGGTRPKARS